MARGRPFDADRAATLVERLVSFALRKYNEAYVAPEHMSALLVAAIAELVQINRSERGAALFLALQEEPDHVSLFENVDQFTTKGLTQHLLKQNEPREVAARVRPISARATAFKHGLSEVRRNPRLLMHRLAVDLLSQKPPQGCCRCGASRALLTAHLRCTYRTWSGSYALGAYECHACLISRMRAPMTSAELASRGYLGGAFSPPGGVLRGSE